MSFNRTLAFPAAVAAAIVALAPAAEARHHGARHHHARALTVRYLPAHQRPDWVGVTSGAVLPGLIDVGYGPIFPFSGLPAKL